MSYTPPLGNAVDFDLVSGYTPSLGNAVDFNLTGPTTTYIDATPLEISSSISSDQPFWYFPLESLQSTCEIAAPALLIELYVPSFVCTGSITSTVQERVALVPIVSTLEIEITAVSVIGPDITVVSPWPFNVHGEIKKPDVSLSLYLPILEINSELDQPFVVAGETSIVFVPPLVCSQSLTSDIGNQLSIEPFNLSFSIELLAIKIFPVGDLYLEMVPFEVANVLNVPLIQAGIILTALEVVSELSIDSIFAGINIDSPSFEVTTELSATTLIGFSCLPLQINSEFASNVNVLISVDPLEMTSSFSNVVIYEGDSIIFPPLEMNSTIGIVAISTVLSVDVLEIENELAIPLISRHVSLTPLVVESELSVDGVVVFTIELSQIFYIFTLTGDADSTTDIEIPIKSFQSRLKHGEPSYLSINTSEFDYVDDIIDRSNGDLVIETAYKKGGVFLRREEIARATLEDIRIDEGARNKTITLSGHKTQTFTSKTVNVQISPTYYGSYGGKVHYRFAQALEVNPGDTVNIGVDSFIIGSISHIVGTTSQTMELAEA